MELATAIKSQYIVDIQNGVYEFKDLNRTRKLNFIDYLNHETNDFDTRSSDEKREKKPLSDVYKEALFARVMVALNKAEQKTATAYFPTFPTNQAMRMHGSRPSSVTQASARKSHSTSAATLSPPSH